MTFKLLLHNYGRFTTPPGRKFVGGIVATIDPVEPPATMVKYEAYNINGYTFCTKSNDGIVYQNSGVSVEAVDLHISKEVATTRKAFYYGVLQEIWLLDYRFMQILGLNGQTQVRNGLTRAKIVKPRSGIVKPGSGMVNPGSKWSNSGQNDQIRDGQTGSGMVKPVSE
ncbi:hypothetical protein Tco_1129717 [Tanacetum coccineum]